jgi:hypothetical protein
MTHGKGLEIEAKLGFDPEEFVEAFAPPSAH